MKLPSNFGESATNYAHEVREEFSRENVDPVFGEDLDGTFVRNYLQTKTDGYFSGEPNANVDGPLPPRDYQARLFSNYGVIDNRPRFEVTFTHEEENFARFNSFHNSVMGEIFTAPMAVSVDLTHDDISERTTKFAVLGNPSRLVRDIVQNDPEMAAVVAGNMDLTIPERVRENNASPAENNAPNTPNGFGGGPA